MIICLTASKRVSEILARDLLEDFITQFSAKDLVINEEERDLLSQIQAADIPVYDLARGLYPYVPLDGPESHAEAVSGTGEGDEPGSIPDGLRIDLSDLGLSAYQQGEIEKRIMHSIRVREDLHPTSYVNGLKEIDLSQISVGNSDTGNVGYENKIRCYKSKTGKVRKAGKSKSRPGEEEMWLTDEQFESMSQSGM